MKFVLPALAILFLTPVHADFADDANTAIRTLQDKWYDTNTGLWYVPPLNPSPSMGLNTHLS